MVAEPQEPQGQAPQQEVREESAQDPVHPSSEQQLEDKLRCMTYCNISKICPNKTGLIGCVKTELDVVELL